MTAISLHAASALIHVRLFGPLEVTRRMPDGTWQTVERSEWGPGTPARSVFKRLLTAPGRRLARADIQEDLWPESSLELADFSVDKVL